MHSLHRVLVYLPDALGTSSDRDSMTEAVRSYAAERIDDYADSVFDWREDNAGRWSDDYPTNVLFANDDVDKFCGELCLCSEAHSNALCAYLESIKSRMGTLDLESIVSDENRRVVGDYITWVGQLISGDYTDDTQFYDTYRGIGVVWDDTIKDVRAHPENCALVLFDCHW